jgi:hypothetical protein
MALGCPFKVGDLVQAMKPLNQIEGEGIWYGPFIVTAVDEKLGKIKAQFSTKEKFCSVYNTYDKFKKV